MAKIITGVSPFGQSVSKTQVTLLRRTNGQWMGYEKRNLSDTFKVPVAEHIHEHPEVILLLGVHDQEKLQQVIGRRDFSVTVIGEENARELPFKFPRPLVFQDLPMG